MGIMKAVSVRDRLKRRMICKDQEKNKYLKTLKLNENLNYKSWSGIKLGATSYFKLKNRCIITGRGKAVNKTFKLSRLEFRRWINKLPGVEKSSW